jgi:hypothetical protein
MLVNSFVIQLATATGFLAAAIAVGGFLAQAVPAMADGADARLRRRAATGGLLGFGAALALIVISIVVNAIV